MESIWSATCSMEKSNISEGDRQQKADVIVIGAGLTGILCAYLLQKQNVDVIVLEAEDVASGVTRNTTAKITSQHDIIYQELIDYFGVEKARKYADVNQIAIDKYAEIIRENQIDCHFERLPAYLYTKQQAERIEKEVNAAQLLGLPASYTKDCMIPDKVECAIRFNHQAQFHPLQFLNGIIKDLKIYEHTKVIHVDKNTVNSTGGTFTADQIIFTTHYPIVNIPGFYFTRVHQERSYLLAYENTAKPDGMYLGIDANTFSFRTYDQYLIFGGSSHRTGKAKEIDCYDSLRTEAKRLYPECQEKYHWSAQDCITLDKVPYIGKYSRSTPNWFVATGFRKWGMTGAMVSALILQDYVIKKENPYSDIFTPQRLKWKASKKHLMEDGKEIWNGIVVKNLVLPKERLDGIETGHGGIINFEGMRVGVYKKSEEEIYMVHARCSHLNCGLEWNQSELTWDCPCHGSRFRFDGSVIENPALEDIERV